MRHYKNHNIELEILYAVSFCSLSRLIILRKKMFNIFEKLKSKIQSDSLEKEKIQNYEPEKEKIQRIIFIGDLLRYQDNAPYFSDRT